MRDRLRRINIERALGLLAGICAVVAGLLVPAPESVKVTVGAGGIALFAFSLLLHRASGETNLGVFKTHLEPQHVRDAVQEAGRSEGIDSTKLDELSEKVEKLLARPSGVTGRAPPAPASQLVSTIDRLMDDRMVACSQCETIFPNERPGRIFIGSSPCQTCGHTGRKIIE